MFHLLDIMEIDCMLFSLIVCDDVHMLWCLLLGLCTYHIDIFILFLPHDLKKREKVRENIGGQYALCHVKTKSVFLLDIISFCFAINTAL